MSRERQGIRVVMALADSALPIDADAIADASARDLQSDVVTRWADEVREAINCAKRCSLNPAHELAKDQKSRQRMKLEAQIAALQRQLLEIDE